jgi:hypothetical protein
MLGKRNLVVSFLLFNVKPRPKIVDFTPKVVPRIYTYVEILDTEMEVQEQVSEKE